MKVEFDNIKIENFYSISEIYYEFKGGITKVTGKNLDTLKDEGKASNGAGKSTIFHAVSQCLFNRNIKGKTTIEGTHNRVTNKPYCITLGMMVGSSYYIITNDRSVNAITITKDGIDITPKGIRNQLSLIESTIQLDFSTFNILTHLTQRNISDVLDVTSDKNLLFKFFDLDKLGFLEKDAKSKLRELKRDYAVTVTNEKSIIQSIAEFDKYSLEDLSKLYESKQHLSNQLSAVKVSPISKSIITDHSEVKTLTSALKIREKSLLGLNMELKTTEESISKLESGMCPVCDSKVKSDGKKMTTLNDTKSKIQDDLQKELESVSSLTLLINAVEENMNKNKEDIKSKVVHYQDEYDRIDKQIIVAEEKNRNYAKFKDSKAKLQIELENINKYKEDLQVALNFINPLLQVIKSGEVTQIYLENFIKFFNIKLKELSMLLDTDFKISAVEASGGIIFDIERASESIDFNLLSSGEQTRVSLIILITTVLTLEIVTSTSTNLLVFDELLSVLDDNGLDIFKSLLNNLKHNKSIFVVLHHDEIEQNYFDQEYLITKKDGLSTMEVR